MADRDSPEQESDAALWLRSCNGDGDAFGQLFDRHYLEVYRRCLSLTGNVAAAEDLVSAVFLQAWRRRHVVQLDPSILPWLIGVSTNLAKNHWRATRRYRRLIDQLPPPPSSPDHAEATVDQVDNRARIRQVERTLRTLPEAERVVVRLCAVGGMTQAEAAAVLGIPVGTVKTRLARARDKLRAADRATSEFRAIGDTP